MIDIGVVQISEDGEVLDTWGNTPRSISGFEAVFQAVVIEIKSEYDEVMDWGSGMPESVRGMQSVEDARSSVVDAVKRARVHVQSGRKYGSSSEILKDLKLSGLEYTGDVWYIQLEFVDGRNESFTYGIQV